MISRYDNTLAEQQAAPKVVAGAPIAWTPGPNLFKDWCAQWFGPDSDDDYLAKAVFNLPPMAQVFKEAAPQQEAQEPVALLVRKNSWRAGQWEVAPPGSPSYGLGWADQRKYVYAAPQPTPAPLSRDQIREVFMAHGFTIKEGQTDLKQYVYDAAYALLELVAAPPAEQQAATKAAPGEPVAWRISCPNEPDLGFWLAEEDGGEGFLSEPLYTRTAPQAAGQDARPCHVFTVRKAGGLTEWEPTTMALALPDGAHALYTLPQPSPHAQADSVTAPAVASEPIAYLYDDGSWTPAKTEEGHKLNNWMISAGSPKIGVHLASAAPLTTLAQATQVGNQQEAQEPMAIKAMGYGGSTGINDYLMSDGTIKAMRPSEVVWAAPQPAPAPLSDALGPLKAWWAMQEAQWGLDEETPEDDAVILHFMGSGASTIVTAGQMRAALTTQGENT